MDQRVRVLLIEDDPDYVMLMSVYINEACGETLKYVLESAVSLQSGLDLLARQEYDIVLLDLMLPDSQGLETLVAVRAKAASVPVVVLTNLDQEDAGLEAIVHGAQDFLPKSKLDAGRLRHAIGFALARDRLYHQMEKLVERSPDGMVIVDRSRMVRYANAAALSLFGRKWERFVGRLFDYPLTPDRAVELRLPHAGAEDVVAEMRVAEIEWKGYPAWLATIRDVSQLKKLAQAHAEVRERVNSDQLKDQLLSSVAHELRTPLSVVKAVVGTLRDSLAGPMNREQTELVATADRHISRLTRLLNNFLDLSRLESRRTRVTRRELDPLELINEVGEGLRMVHHGKTVVTFDLPKNLPAVKVDADMIAQVLGNLLDNALRYARSSVIVHAEVKGDEIEVSVSDDGPGIPEGKAKDLFDKFVQLDRPKGGGGHKGTGLGLAISREIITLNGGRIWADECGKGAYFRFTLPLASPRGAAPREADRHAHT